ncbi:unnamed protein product, partial [Ixodes pacificus]
LKHCVSLCHEDSGIHKALGPTSAGVVERLPHSTGLFLLRTFRFYFSHAVQWHLTGLSAIYILKRHHVMLSKSSQMQFCMKDHSNSWHSSRWTEQHCANGDKPLLLMMIVPRRRAYWHLTACITGARWCA